MEKVWVGCSSQGRRLRPVAGLDKTLSSTLPPPNQIQQVCE